MQRKITLLGLTLAGAMLLSYVESLIPPLSTVPGIKIGLANIAVIFALCRIGMREAYFVSLIRVLLSSLLFGNAVSVIYGLCGAVLSLISMTILKKINIFSVLGISIVGAVMHNVGQILAAIIILGSNVIVLYLPILILSGTITGAIIGVLSAVTIKRIKA